MTLIEYSRILLAEKFGYDSFRPGQEEIIDALLAGNNVLGVLPTGAGKSICYQIPALIVKNLTLVVSPLIALMKDQSDSLNARTIPARVLHSGVSIGDANNIIYEASRGLIRVLFVAPERLENKSFRQTLKDLAISLVVVDEAHCISEWGHDFRPAYQNITTIFEHIPVTPVLALTATATPDVRVDIRKQLKFEKCVEIVRGFDRPNLSFAVQGTKQKAEFVAREYYKQSSGAMIVYCGSRRRVDTMYEELRKRRLPALAYHAGMNADKRAEMQEAFLETPSPILIATNAFGMGIDKPDVRHVLHADLTLTLEAYYQEAGRAGRDGLNAKCTLMFEKTDQRLMRFFIDCSNPSVTDIGQVYAYLYARAGVPIGQGQSVMVEVDDVTVASDTDLPVPLVKTCLSYLAKHGIMIQQTARGLARFEIMTSRERMAEYESNSPASRRRLLQALLRSVSGNSYSRAVEFSVDSFLRENGFSNKEFSEAIGALQVSRLIRFTPPAQGSSVLLLKDRMQSVDGLIDTQELLVKRERANEKFSAVMRYVETNQCKRNFILEYFADPDIHGKCGRCSSCKSPAKSSTTKTSKRSEEIAGAIIETVLELGGQFGRNVVVDVLTGTVSLKALEYDLTRCRHWSKFSTFTRSELLRELDEALERSELIKTADRFPVVNVGPNAHLLVDVTIPRLTLSNNRSIMSEADSKQLRALSELRNQIATETGSFYTTIFSDSQLLQIAKDHPKLKSDLIAGKHGSGLTLARYGSRIIECMAERKTAVDSSYQHVHLDDEIRKVVEVLRPHRQLSDVAKLSGLTKATAAQYIQRALEMGVEIERVGLIDDEMFANVLEFMRYNRFARLRSVREHIDGTVEMPELRLAVAFARKLLMNEVQ